MIGVGLMAGKILQPIGKHDPLFRHGEDEQMLPRLKKSESARGGMHRGARHFSRLYMAGSHMTS